MVTAYKTHIHLGVEWDAFNWCLVCPPTLLWLVKYLQKWKWTICNLRQWKDHISVLASPPTVRTICPKRSYEEQSCPTFPYIYIRWRKKLMESNPFFLWKKNYLSKVILWSSFNGIPRSFRNRCFNGRCLQLRPILVGVALLFDNTEGTGWASRTPKAIQVSLIQERRRPIGRTRINVVFLWPFNYQPSRLLLASSSQHLHSFPLFYESSSELVLLIPSYVAHWRKIFDIYSSLNIHLWKLFSFKINSSIYCECQIWRSQCRHSHNWMGNWKKSCMLMVSRPVM